MFIKDKTKNIKATSLTLKIGVMTEINDEYICPNNKRLGFKRYAYRHDKYGFKRLQII